MIYYFGDSNTRGIGTDGSPRPEELIHIPYSTYLNELSGMPSKNFAKCGQNFLLNIKELTHHLEELERRAKVIIFQTQFFCNPLLRFPKKEKDNLQDFTVTSYLLNKNPDINGEFEKEFTKHDKQVMADWSYKFEERRSYYEYLYLIDIFRYLSGRGIQCKILHWLSPFTLKLPKNEFVIPIEGKMCGSEKSYDNFIEYLSMTHKNFLIKDVTNGEWDDVHTANSYNKLLAEIIHEQLF